MRLSILILLWLWGSQAVAAERVDESGSGLLAATMTLEDNHHNPMIITSVPNKSWDSGRRVSMKRLEDATYYDYITMDDGAIKNIYGECLHLNQQGVPLWWDCDDLNTERKWWTDSDGHVKYWHWDIEHDHTGYRNSANCLRVNYNSNKWELLSRYCDNTTQRADEAFYFKKPEEPRGKRLINNGKCLEKMRGKKIKLAHTGAFAGAQYTRQYNPKLRECSNHPDQFWVQLHLTSDFQGHVSDTVIGTSIIWNTSEGMNPIVTPEHEAQCLANYGREEDGNTFRFAQLAPAKDNPISSCKEMVILDGQIITSEGYTLREDSFGKGTVFFTDGTNNQRWHLTEYQEFYIGDRCIAAAGNGTGNYTKIIPWKCNDHDSQKWAMDGDGLIRSKMAWWMCLDVLNYDPNEYAPIHLYKCHGDYNQQFYWKDGRLLSRLNDKAVTFNGGTVVLLDPKDSVEQKFKVYPPNAE